MTALSGFPLFKVMHGLALELLGPTSGWMDDGGSPFAPSLVPYPPEGSLMSAVSFPTRASARGRWIRMGSEVLSDAEDPPGRRYGLGVLHPQETDIVAERRLELEGVEPGAEDEATTPEGTPGTDDIFLVKEDDSSPENDAVDLSAGSAFAAAGAVSATAQSAMGISFLADLDGPDTLMCEYRGSVYQPLEVVVEGTPKRWWQQVPVRGVATFDLATLVTSRKAERQLRLSLADGSELESSPVIGFVAVARPSARGYAILTVSVQNITPPSEHPDFVAEQRSKLFQSHLGAWLQQGNDVRSSIRSYPASPAGLGDAIADPDLVSLQYRNRGIFAVGHSCAAEWENDENSPHVKRVFGVPLPVVLLPGTTPTVTGADGASLEVGMADLARHPERVGHICRPLLDAYEHWIAEQEQELNLAVASMSGSNPSLAQRWQRAGDAQLVKARDSLERMKKGVAYLNSSPTAARAFGLANHALLLSQAVGQRLARRKSSEAGAPYVPPCTFPDDLMDISALEGLARTRDRGAWRPFQIAFLLATIESVGEPTSADRDQIDVLWFPTGGGKTEAYLGLTAFTLFLARLRRPTEPGLHVITRYTLRLLSRQQYERAASVVCAAEALRPILAEELGPHPFSIGFWVGGDVTPNSRSESLEKLDELLKAPNKSPVLDRCPLCAAYIGTVSTRTRAGRDTAYEVHGVRTAGVGGGQRNPRRVEYFCPDPCCPMHARLPVFDVDEEVFRVRPSVIVGTVDKFAGVAWRTEYKGLFGLDDEDGRVVRKSAPPALVIQDEIHLMTGPLGSVAGLYEAAVEELCLDKRGGVISRPKVVAASATLSGYEAQVKSLFARSRVALFPPGGISQDDSFFARTDKSSLGKVHVGLFPSNLRSGQTAQVRTFSALLQAAKHIAPVEKADPYWTNLAYFNTKSELGFAQSLLQADVPDYLGALQGRLDMWSGGSRYGEGRDLKSDGVIPLTGDLSAEDAQDFFKRLEVPFQPGDDNSIDVCLATNLIEVGVDVDRLALMTVIGQPKALSSYIQATGRVGRQWWDSPALVVDLFGTSKSRDQSHFERYRSYHERLNASVEPVSVTPFSEPLLDRAAHAVMLALVRQCLITLSDQKTHGPAFISSAHWAWAAGILEDRASAVDPKSAPALRKVLQRRWEELSHWKYGRWQAQAPDKGLYHFAGFYAPQDILQSSWALPTSMRDVDGLCRPAVTTHRWT